MVDALLDKMKEHVKNGFINNTKVEFLESEMYNLTLNLIMRNIIKEALNSTQTHFQVLEETKKNVFFD